MRISLSTLGSICILDAHQRLIGFAIQNLSATIDVYFSDDQRMLDTVDAAATNVPTGGFRLGGAVNLGIVVVDWPFLGKLYARAAGIVLSPAPQIEILPFYGDPIPVALTKGPR